MNKKFIIGAATLLLASSVAVPVASAQSKETRQLMADIRILQIQAQELQNLVTALNQSMADALKAVNTRLNEQTDMNRKAFADQKVTIDAASNDLRVLRERVDDGSVRIGTLTQEVDALRELVTAMRAGPPAAGPVSEPIPGAPPAEQAVAPPPPAPSGAASIGMSPERFWTAVMDDYYRGDYDIAVMGFEQYVRAFPTGAKAVEAQVNIGHSYMMQGKYDKAIEAYDTAIRTYPPGEAIAEAYFKKGEAHLNLKQADRAREAWQFVIKTYPDSNAALQAKQRLLSVQ